MNMIIKELNDRHMVEGSHNASCIIQSIEKLNNDLKQSSIQHLGNPTANRNANISQRIINQIVLNPGLKLKTEPQESDSHDVKRITEIDGIWAHYWGGHLYPIPLSFFFSNN